ncbi:MAG: hypothetical protein WC581_13695, partial [Thermodesulfovibrionales bacterium]
MKLFYKNTFVLFILLASFFVVSDRKVFAVTQAQACTGSGCSLKCGICIANNNCSLNRPAVSNSPLATQYGLPVTHFCLSNSDCTNTFQGVSSPGTNYYGTVLRCGIAVPVGTRMTISNCGYEPTFTTLASSQYTYLTNIDSVNDWLRTGSLNGELLSFYIRDPVLGNLTYLGSYTFNTAEANKQLNFNYCPVPTPTPTPTPTRTPTPTPTRTPTPTPTRTPTPTPTPTPSP